MPDIDNKERGIDAGTKLINRGAAPSGISDAGSATGPERESGYWTPASKVHRVIFPNVPVLFLKIDANFDFKPFGDKATKGTVEGVGTASSYKGAYEILANTPENLQIYVRLGTTEKPNEKMDATLSIGKNGATVKGTLDGKVQEAGNPLPVNGSGTAKDPYRVAFPDQEVRWYVP